MIRRVLRDGWKIEDAMREAEKIGLGDHPALSEFARKYIERHRQAAMPSYPLSLSAFIARFDPAGTFTIEGAVRWVCRRTAMQRTPNPSTI
jgi:hypothetical protein